MKFRLKCHIPVIHIHLRHPHLVRHEFCIYCITYISWTCYFHPEFRLAHPTFYLDGSAGMFKHEVPTGTPQDWSTLGKSPKFDAYLHEYWRMKPVFFCG